jgi:hypothetical protein
MHTLPNSRNPSLAAMYPMPSRTNGLISSVNRWLTMNRLAGVNPSPEGRIVSSARVTNYSNEGSPTQGKPTLTDWFGECEIAAEPVVMQGGLCFSFSLKVASLLLFHALAANDHQAAGPNPVSKFSKYLRCFTSGRYCCRVCHVKIAAPLTPARLAIVR